jgi:peptide/nickel transport system permease protein
VSQEDGATSRRGQYWRRLKRRPVSLIGIIIFVCFLLLAAFGPWIAPYSITEQAASLRLQPPSFAHPFGTDAFGRDVLSRIIVGTRSVVVLSGLGTILAVLLGTPLGMFSGYIGGVVDEVIMRTLDVFLSIPSLLLALVLLSTLGPSSRNILIILAVLYAPMIARIVRSMTLDLRNKEFVEAAKARGDTKRYILFREVLPGTVAPLLVEASMRFSYAIFLVASLGFLGLGVQPPAPDWGLLISEARDFFTLAPWSLLFPAAAIGLLVVSVNLTTDGLRQILQPERGGL